MNLRGVFRFLAGGGALCTAAAEPPPKAAQDPLRYLENYNVVWTTPSASSAQSMPLGGGDLGCNVWVENGDLLLYAQQSGAFDKNGEFLKLGRFRIHLTPNPFAPGGRFRQELRLRPGCIEVSGDTPASGAIRIRLWVEVKRPVVHIDLEGDRPTVLNVAYESWRHRDVVIAPQTKPPHQGRRSSTFDFDCFQEDLVKPADFVELLPGGVVFCQDNAARFNAVDFAIQTEELGPIASQIWNPLRGRVSGGCLRSAELEFKGTTDGIYIQTPFRAWNFQSRTSALQHQLEIFASVAQPVTRSEWKKRLLDLAAAKPDRAALWAANEAWWDAFWSRAYVIVNPRKDATDNGWRVGRNYNLFRYQLGGNFYGRVPTKFNGGNLTWDAGLVLGAYPYDPDYRRWGGWSYTSANQRLVYWPFLKNGDFDGMLSEFDVYRNGLGNAEAQTRLYFGHGGASFAEQFQLSGLPVAAMYGFVRNGYSWRVRPALFPRGVLQNPAISTFYQGQLEHAFMILEYQRFSGRDISAYLPFILSSIRYYDEHFQQIHLALAGRPLDERGKLVIFPSTPGENHLHATNPADAVAGLQAIAAALLALPPHSLKPEQLAYVAGFQKRVPDLPVYRRRVGDTEQTYLAMALNDETRGGGFYPNLHAVFPYNLYYAGGPGFDRAFATWRDQITPANKQAYIGHRPSVIYSARMGLMDEARFTLSHKLDDVANDAVRAAPNEPAGPSGVPRFPTFVGPGFDWSPDHNWPAGGMIGMQEMLLQTPGRELRLLPAWPPDWDVTFRLHAPYDTTVEVRFEGGRIMDLKVTPAERLKDVRLPSLSPAPPAASAVHAALQTAIDTGEVAGAVAVVVTKDAVLDAQAAGFADLAAHAPMRTDTIFWIASMTKPVTGVATLMLQDDGKLDVSDLVEKYIPAFAGLRTPSGQPARITIRQLLTHTSGLGEAPDEAARKAHTLADLTPLILAARMQSEPGTRWKYCQAGINTAARIVEIASGMPFDEFVHRRILDPLGMKDTTFRRTPAVMARLATAYAKSKTTGELQPVPPRADFGLADEPPYGNAGLYSTGPDYARFCQMLLGGGVLGGRRYLSPAAYRLLTTVQTGTLETGFLQSPRDGARGANYGWGIGTAILRSSHDGVGAMLSPGTFGHGGAWGTQAWIDPVTGRAYILMLQRSNFANADNTEIRRAFQAAAVLTTKS